MTTGAHTAYLICSVLCICACSSARQVTRNAQRHRLNQGPALAAEGYVMTYDARARGAYFVRQADGKPQMKFCAEPPPDVAADLEAKSDLAVDVDAALQLKAVEATLAGGVNQSDSATSEIANAVTRTELMLVMRDAMYRICESNANGILDDERAQAEFEALMRLARSMGQRDNVGKLIEVVKTVASTKDSGIAPDQLAQILDTALRLATADQIIGPEGVGGPLVQAAVQKQLLETLVGVQAAQTALVGQIETLRKAVEAKQSEIEATKAKTKPTKQEKQRVETLKEEVEDLQMQLRTLEPLL